VEIKASFDQNMGCTNFMRLKIGSFQATDFHCSMNIRRISGSHYSSSSSSGALLLVLEAAALAPATAHRPAAVR
jgi:hypothetical protein